MHVAKYNHRGGKDKCIIPSNLEIFWKQPFFSSEDTIFSFSLKGFRSTALICISLDHILVTIVMISESMVSCSIYHSSQLSASALTCVIKFLFTKSIDGLP